MSDFLLPGGLYKIYYKQGKKKQDKSVLPFYKALIIVVSFEGLTVFTERELHGKDVKKQNFVYDAIEMTKGSPRERFPIYPNDISRFDFLKMFKDIREWPLEAIQTYFTYRGVSRQHIDELYNRDLRTEDVDFTRFHMRAAIRKRRVEEQARKKRPGKQIKALYLGVDTTGSKRYCFEIGGLDRVEYRMTKEIESLIFGVDEHIIMCFNSDGLPIHTIPPQWTREQVALVFGLNEVRTVAPKLYVGSNYSTTNYDSSGSSNY